MLSGSQSTRGKILESWCLTLNWDELEVYQMRKVGMEDIISEKTIVNKGNSALLLSRTIMGAPG